MSAARHLLAPPPTRSRRAADGAWTWYNSPRAVCSGRTEYVGYLNTSGDVCVSSRNLDLGTSVEFVLHAALQADDHDNPAIWVRPDGHIVCFYATHAADGLVRYRVSTNVGDITAFDAEQTITMPDAAKVTYANVRYLASEARVYLFCRVTPAGQSTFDNPAMLWSDDLGATWTAPVVYFDAANNRPYVHFHGDGAGRIDFFASEGHPREISAGTGHMFHWYMSGGNFYQTDGTLIRSVASLSPSSPLLHSEVTKVYDATADKGDAVNGNAWPWSIVRDHTGTPYVCFSVFSAVGDNRYFWARWTGSAWDLHQLLTREPALVAGSSEPQYVGGMDLNRSNPNIVYLSAKGLGRQWQMQKRTTPDNGASWIVESLTSDLETRKLRPFCPYNPVAECSEVLWLQGDYTMYLSPSFNTAVWGSP